MYGGQVPYSFRVKRRNSHKNADFHIAIATQGGGLRVVGGHQGGDGSSHLAPYSHWVGFVCMRGAPSLVDPDTPRALILLAGGTPIHAKPTQWLYGARCELPSPLRCPHITPYGHCVPLYIQLHAFHRTPGFLRFTQESGFCFF